MDEGEATAKLRLLELEMLNLGLANPTSMQKVKHVAKGFGRAAIDIIDMPANIEGAVDTGLKYVGAEGLPTEGPFKKGTVPSETVPVLKRAKELLASEEFPRDSAPVVDTLRTGVEWGAMLPLAAATKMSLAPDILAAGGAMAGEVAGDYLSDNPGAGELIGGLLGTVSGMRRKTPDTTALNFITDSLQDKNKSLEELRAALLRGDEGTLGDLTGDVGAYDIEAALENTNAGRVAIPEKVAAGRAQIAEQVQAPFGAGTPGTAAEVAGVRKRGRGARLTNAVSQAQLAAQQRAIEAQNVLDAEVQNAPRAASDIAGEVSVREHRKMLDAAIPEKNRPAVFDGVDPTDFEAMDDVVADWWGSPEAFGMVKDRTFTIPAELRETLDTLSANPATRLEMADVTYDAALKRAKAENKKLIVDDVNEAGDPITRRMTQEEVLDWALSGEIDGGVLMALRNKYASAANAGSGMKRGVNRQTSNAFDEAIVAELPLDDTADFFAHIDAYPANAALREVVKKDSVALNKGLATPGELFSAGKRSQRRGSGTRGRPLQESLAAANQEILAAGTAEKSFGRTQAAAAKREKEIAARLAAETRGIGDRGVQALRQQNTNIVTEYANTPNTTVARLVTSPDSAGELKRLSTFLTTKGQRESFVGHIRDTLMARLTDSKGNLGVRSIKTFENAKNNLVQGGVISAEEADTVTTALNRTRRQELRKASVAKSVREANAATNDIVSAGLAGIILRFMPGSHQLVMMGIIKRNISNLLKSKAGPKIEAALVDYTINPQKYLEAASKSTTAMQGATAVLTRIVGAGQAAELMNSEGE